ncbi:MAG: hypothetical protein FWF02_09205, partial [Micrococcales bacterium]|nr:hypothetical protein [Micrococcales bacterium]
DPVSQPLQGHTDQADQGPLADDPRLPEFFGPAWPKVPRVRSAAIGQLEGRAVVTTGSEDDTVQVWDLDTNEPVGDPLPHTSRVFSAVFGQLEGRTILATGNYDGTVRLWDPTSGRPAAPAIHALAPVNDLAVSDGVLALATDAGLAVLGPEFLATVLDTPGQDQP